ncbi:hypothetical protein OG369_37965 [Streptomyces sp. NBC_01221]|uniref:hypothetical protein n=1 Tax=unclassified Streptomyces TaxID=2593676 RepID=UPI00225A2B04|nr:hypothetical protein [Streptomyces sp. NBC_01221]MCX4791669.1 hypothetical protein [Streptomyces sp. NBC_01221]
MLLRESRGPLQLRVNPGGSGALGSGPAQGGGLGRRDQEAPLCTDRLDRGRRIIRDDVGLGELPAGQLPHHLVLPFHRFHDGRVHPGRRRDGTIGFESEAVAVRQGPAPNRRGGQDLLRGRVGSPHGGADLHGCGPQTCRARTAIGQGWADGLDGLARAHGVDIE